MVRRRDLLRWSAGCVGVGMTGSACTSSTSSTSVRWERELTEHFRTAVPLGGFTPAADGRLATGAASAAYGADLITYPDGWRGTNGLGHYYPSRTLSVQSGRLTIQARAAADSDATEAAAIGPWQAQQYGRWRWRMRGDTQHPGWLFVCLLWPDDDSSWPQSGELDWPEGDLTEDLAGFFHPRGATSGEDQRLFSGLGYRWNSWHEFEIEWTPKHVVFRIDGRTASRVTDHIPDVPMRWVLQGGPASATSRPRRGSTATVQLDWLTVDRYIEE